MSRNQLAFAVYVCVLTAVRVAVAQQPTPADLEMMKTWSMKLDTDKLTDAKVFTATATAHADDNPAHLYQLVLTCDGQPRELSLTAFDTTDAPAGMMRPRPIEWQSRVVTTGGEVTARAGNTNGPPTKFAPVVQNEVTVPEAIRFRVDSANAAVSRLEHVAENVGRLSLTDIFIPNTPRMDTSGVLTAEQERALGRLQALTSGEPLTPTLPKTRLLIADVFPNETVEFNFSTLTPDARSALRKMCRFDMPIGTSATPSSPPAAWTDRASGEKLSIPDVWVRPGQLKPLRDYTRVSAILKAVDAPMQRDQFESTDAFEQRKRNHAAELANLLAEPLLLVGEGGSGPNGAFRYDADHGVMQAVIMDGTYNHSPGILSDGKQNTYVSLSLPNLELVLLLPGAPFLHVQPPPKRSLSDVIGGAPRQSASTTVLPVVCQFPMPPDDARQRIGSLSLLFNVPVRTVLPANKNLRGFSGDNPAPYGVLTDSVDNVDVWIVDSAAKERIARMPLSACILRP